MLTTLHTHTLEGLPLCTGDILCTRDGRSGTLFARIWRLLGLLVPGEIDHVLMYIGPGGRCVESGARGVITFDMPGCYWVPRRLLHRRSLLDELIGAAYPLEGRGLSAAEETDIRLGAANFCLVKAAQRTPYNINFFNPATDGAFYCSQLVYKAYLEYGIDLNINQGVPCGPLLDNLVLPQEIWNACAHRRVGEKRLEPCPES
jgi:hypothetical protein